MFRKLIAVEWVALLVAILMLAFGGPKLNIAAMVISAAVAVSAVCSLCLAARRAAAPPPTPDSWPALPEITCNPRVIPPEFIIPPDCTDR